MFVPYSSVMKKGFDDQPAFHYNNEKLFNLSSFIINLFYMSISVLSRIKKRLL